MLFTNHRAVLMPWPTLAPRFDDRPATRAMIAYLVLSTDLATEADMRRYLHLDGVECYVARMPMAEVATPETLSDLKHGVVAATKQLAPWATFDAFGFSCTSGSIAVGTSEVTRLVNSVRPGVPVNNPVDSAIQGLKKLGATDIAVLTPYLDEVNSIVETYFAEQGLNIVHAAGFKQNGDPEMNRIDPESILEAGAEVAAQGGDALFISCTGLRTAGIVQRLEDRIGKPVVTSNQALAWTCLRSSGIDDPVAGFGKLMTI